MMDEDGLAVQSTGEATPLGFTGVNFVLLKGREMVKELEPWKSYIENLPAGSLTIVCPFFK